MRRGTRRKLKVYAVDAAMIFLAAQFTIVVNADRDRRARSVYTPYEITRTTSYEVEPETEAQEVETEETHSLVFSRDWGSEDEEILLKIAMAEAEGESTEGKALVMCVVLNRVWSDGFPDTIEEVVFEPGQFSPVEDGGRYWTTEPNEDCYEALQMVQQGWDESEGALYFCSGGTCDWMNENLEYLYEAGNHCFYK